MAARRFKSKIDTWILVVIAFAIVGQFVAVTAAALSVGDPLATTGLMLLAIMVSGAFVWMLLGTYYTVDGDTIRVVSGPFRRSIAIDDVTKVRATRSLLSSPALSVDRLVLHFGKHQRVMISPADRAGFLKAIGHELPK